MMRSALFTLLIAASASQFVLASNPERGDEPALVRILSQIYENSTACDSHEQCPWDTYCEVYILGAGPSNFTQCTNCALCEKRLREGKNLPVDGECPERCILRDQYTSKPLSERFGAAAGRSTSLFGVVAAAAMSSIFAFSL